MNSHFETRLPQAPLEPLPEAQSEYFGPTNFVWLVRGRLAGMPRPGLTHPIDQDLDALLRIGVDTIVTLTEEWEPPAEMTEIDGLDVHHVPIPDMEPPTMAQALETCAMVADAVSRGHSVVFHCRAGRGRTGTMLAAMLIWYDADSERAIRQVKGVNPNWIESSSQMDFLKDFAAERRKTLAPPPEARTPQEEPEGTRSGRSWFQRFFQRRSHLGTDHEPAEATSTNSRVKEHGMSLDKALQSSMSGVPECLASGYVDMETGMLLGIQTVDSHPQEVLDVLAAATADLFQGSNIVNIENIFKKSRGTESDDSHYFHEMIVFSENLLHVFMRTKKYPDHVCCFVCRKSANPGMVLTKARMSLDPVTAAL